MALSSAQKEQAQQLVTELLQVCDSDELKTQNSPDAEAKALELASKLEAIGKDEDWLSDSTLVGSYQLMFQQVGKRSPVGGIITGSPLGRFLFTTLDVYNNILPGNRAVNSLYFKFLKVIPGSVSLAGQFVRTTPEERKELTAKYNPPSLISANTIKLSLSEPLVRSAAAGLINFNVAPATTVFLDTLYLDHRIRVSRSARFGNFILLKRVPPSSPTFARANAGNTLPSTPKVPTAVPALYALGSLLLLLRPDFLLPDQAATAPVPRRAALGFALLLLPLLPFLLLAPL